MADKKISQLTGATTPVAGTEVLPIVQGGSTVKVSIDNVTAGRAVNGLSFTATKTGNDAFIKVQNSGAGAAGAWVFVDSVDPAYRGVVVQSGGVENWVIGGYGTSELQVIRGSRGAGTEVFRYLGTNDVKVSAGNLVVGTAAKGIDFPSNAAGGTRTSTLLNWYEEGSWAPSALGITLTSATGYYTRIGRLVNLQAKLVFPTTASGSDTVLRGMPFKAAYETPAVVAMGSAVADGVVGLMFTGATPEIYLLKDNNGSGVALSYFSGATVYLSISYMV